MSAAVKKQLARTLTATIDGRTSSALQQQGLGLPCSVTAVAGAVVTVAFEVSSEFTFPPVTCPIAESFYVRLPIQVGDKGYLVPSRARLGGVSGLGSGLAPLVQPSNLGGLVFEPIGNAAWATIDPNAVVVNAPNGAVLRTIGGESVVTIDTGKVKVVQGDVTVTITGGVVTVDADHVVVNATDSTFNGDLIVNGDVSITGNTTADGSVTITGNVGITGSTSMAGPVLMTGAVAIVGSLSINSKDFTTHEHVAQGSLRAGSTVITGNTGTLL